MPRPLHQVLELHSVNRRGADVEEIPAVPGHDERVPNSCSESRRVRENSRGLLRRARPVAPQRIDQLVDGEHSTGRRQEHTEQPPLLRSAKVDSPAFALDVDRSEDSVAHLTSLLKL